MFIRLKRMVFQGYFRSTKVVQYYISMDIAKILINIFLCERLEKGSVTLSDWIFRTPIR